MVRSALASVVLTLVVAGVLSARSDPAHAAPPLPALDAPHPAYAPGRVLVRFQPHLSGARQAAVRTLVGARARRSLPVPGLELVGIDPGLPVPQAVALLEHAPGVMYAEPDYTRVASVALNDPYLSTLWGLDGEAGIDAPAAWDRTAGAGAAVAVVDSGVDLTHPDLEPNLWRNPGESGQGKESNEVDDDGNGLVDDWRGWDWVDDDNDPTDRNGHGTHVAGTIAARGNDRSGIAGVAWKAAVVPLRILNEDAVGSVSGLVSAYAYARRQGIPVVNASVEDALYSRSEYEAMAMARDTLFVVAAGNDGADVDSNPIFPCDYELPNLICVAATTRSGALADFSNYGGRSVDVAAPGSGIFSTWIGGGWRTQSGTSMAAPHAAGVAALVAALTRTSGTALRQVLVDSAVPTTVLRGKVAAGRLSAYRAVGGAFGTTAAGRLRLRLRLARQTLAGALRRGVRLRTACSHACRLTVQLSLRPSTRGAARHSSHRHWIAAGTGRARLREGRLVLAVKVRTALRRKLRRMHRARLAVRAVAVDGDRARTVLIRRMTLSRRAPRQGRARKLLGQALPSRGRSSSS